ncbi:MAG: response regulator [Chitinispirillaceae bacterium]|nr:response regulator [Chitinispirillaceae bacterium]
MTFQTQKNFIGKDQTILAAEIQSERLISIVRLAGAVFFSVVAIFSFLLGSTSLSVFGIQMTALMLVYLYSGFFLFNSGKRKFHESFIYLPGFLDIVVISVIIWSYYLNGAGVSMITGSVSGIYFIVIIFTALHHKLRLSIFCGISAAVAYSVLYYLFTRGAPVPPQYTNDYPIHMVLLLTAAVLGGIVSRNNSRTIHKVISSEIRYHNLVHRLPEMLFTLDAHGNFIWANIASASITGIPAKVLPGRNIRNILSQPDSFKLDTNGMKGTFGVTDINGNEKFVDLIIQPVSENEDLVAFDGIISDVTDREKAISQREEMVQRLFQYQKMESLGMLASGMAHDFNNILQTVNDLSAIILRDSKEDETRRRIELINETMVDARFLISELFALGRKKPLDYRHVNINSLMEQIVPQFSRQLGPNYLLTLETPEEKLWLEGDPDHLKRIFQNLVGNARDAMPEGGNITISCEKVIRSSSEGVIHIRVSDTGTGIPQELSEKVFDPFFTTKKPGKGTGLGLALVRRIVMLHNGTISIEKSGYQGTTFLIELPLSDERELDSDTKALMMNRLPATVLLLDDDRKIRDVLKIFLKEFKYSVLEASDGSEALEELKKNFESCSVLIMDWKLGNENPHQVIRSLRSIRRDLIVIVVSGYPPQEKSIEKMMITRWFTKPYDRNLLDIEIQRALHRVQAKRHGVEKRLENSPSSVVTDETSDDISVE